MLCILSFEKKKWQSPQREAIMHQYSSMRRKVQKMITYRGLCFIKQVHFFVSTDYNRTRPALKKLTTTCLCSWKKPTTNNDKGLLAWKNQRDSLLFGHFRPPFGFFFLRRRRPAEKRLGLKKCIDTYPTYDVGTQLCSTVLNLGNYQDQCTKFNT